jgi:predicted Rossmann fold nucleotide-binding protein DprA/Smf involved in DNA uptake
VTRRPDASLACLLLSQRLVEAGAPPLKAAEYWEVLDTVADPAALLAADATAITSLGLAPELAGRVATRLGAATAFAVELDEAERTGMRLLASVDDDYPAELGQRLGRRAPPLLYTVGAPGLLRRGGLGIVGPHEVDEAGASVARQAAEAAAAARVAVLSGRSRGIDRIAMAAAQEAGGDVVGVLADPLAQVVREPELRRAVTAGRLCLCSPYAPTDQYSAPRARGRDKIVYALADAVLVVAAAEDEGTWAGATEALELGLGPVLVWCGAGEGPANGRLVSMGATPVDDVRAAVETLSGGR